MFCACALAAAHAQYDGKKIFTIHEKEGDEPRILTLYQNLQGYILAGTSKGLYRFDGMDFYKYAQDSITNGITALCQTGGDSTWVGFDNGYIGLLTNNRIQLLKLDEGYPKVTIKKIVAGPNAIWIATAGEGLYYYKNKKLYNINADDGLSDNYVYDISLTSMGDVRAATDRGLNIVSIANNEKHVSFFSAKNGLPDNIVRCLHTVQDTYTWLGMQDAGILCCNNNFKISTHTGTWGYGQVNDIAATSSQVFAATEENGLIVYDHDAENNITTLSYQDKKIPKISSLLNDREGNIWAAGDNFLMRTNGSNIEKVYGLKKPVAEAIHCLLYAKDKSIWYNAGNALIKLYRNGNSWAEKKYNLASIADIDISSLYQDNTGTIWVGTLGKGICLLNPATGVQSLLKNDSLLLNSNIISISGKDSTVWISSLEGIVCAKISNGKTTFINYTGIKNIGSIYVNYIFPDSKNRIWFATDGKGVFLHDNDRYIDFSKQAPYGNVVYRITEDSAGHIWYSTYKNGVVKYDGNKFYNYTTRDGLSDININGLAAIRNNVIVLHKDKLDIINAKTGIISYIDEEQGIYDINTDLNAYATDTEGNIYFIADSSLCRYHASNYAAHEPTVMINSIQLFLQDIQASSGHTFRYNENNISFHYTGLYYSQPEKIMYQYKLDGYDKAWVDTKDKIKNFPQLLPGTYTFRIRAALNNNFSIAREASFSFVIQKPYWQTAWFIVLIIGAAGALLILIIKTRERSIDKYNRLAQEKIRSQLETLRSQINPHFLFNSFNTLISEIEEHPENAVTYVEKLSDFYRSIVMNREKDLILLQEELEILNDYIFIQQKRYGSAVQVANSISAVQAKTLYITPLALQLLIENAIKHNVVSLETPLLVELFIDPQGCLVVRNNITKKLEQEKGSRMGLQNIQKRYELISRKAVMIENDEKYFTVKIPLLKNPL